MSADHRGHDAAGRTIARRSIARRTVLGAGAVGLGTTLTAACARIPTSGEIHRTPLGGGTEPGVPYVRPRRPEDDATPQQIISGFVQAGVGPEDDYAIAREYLAPSIRESWDPGAAVTLFSSSHELLVEQIEDTTLELTLETVGTIDARGARTLLATSAARRFDFTVEETDEGWRITELPDGMYLSDSYFDILFTPVRLYFPDPRGIHLVPDLRWFPDHRAVGAVLQALVDGPVDALAPAVTSAVPEDADLAQAVIDSGEGGELQLDLPDSIARMPDQRRDVAIAQIRASLRSMGTLSDVGLMLDGSPAPSDGSGTPTSPLPGHRPIAAGDRGVVSLADLSADEDAEQLVPEFVDEIVRDPALAQDGPLAAALNEERSAVILASTDGSVPRRDVAVGTDLLAPRIDDAGYVWTTGEVNPGALVALSAEGGSADAKVDAGWLAGRTVLSLDIAPDATRMLVLSAAGADARLDLCAVVRDETGVPSALADPVRLTIDISDIRWVGWYDEASLIVLGEVGDDGDKRAMVVALQGENDRLPDPPPDIERLAGTAVADMICASTSGGALMRIDGADWTEIKIPGTDPSFY